MRAVYHVFIFRRVREELGCASTCSSGAIVKPHYGPIFQRIGRQSARKREEKEKKRRRKMSARKSSAG